MSDFTNHIIKPGDTFGHLTAISMTEGIIGRGGVPTQYWTCRCDCGNTIQVTKTMLLNNHTKSCGCRAKRQDEIILKGFEFDENFNKINCLIQFNKEIKKINYKLTYDEVLKNPYRIKSAIIYNDELMIDTTTRRSKRYKSGDQVGDWTLTEFVGATNEASLYGHWLCTCKCGAKSVVAESSLYNGESKRCPRCKGQSYFKQRTATSDWEPIEFDHTDVNLHGASYWKYRCKHCGAIKILAAAKVDSIDQAPRCDCQRQFSRLEDDIYNFISQYIKIPIQRSVKNLIAPYEIDIYIPDMKLAIECNGDYWHRADIRGMSYHKMKTKMCNNKNIRLIHIFEYEWFKNKDKIKNYLLQQLGINSNVIYARDCELRQISNTTAIDFCNAYHLQNGINSNECYGLFYNNELIEVMTFGKARFNTQVNTELLRLCAKTGYNIIGGASKLFKHYINLHPKDSIVSYCNIAKFTGSVYEQLGFVKCDESDPNYVYVDNHWHVLSRYQTQKKELIKLGYDPTMSEAEIMTGLGYYKVYDCGNAIYIYNT